MLILATGVYFLLVSLFQIVKTQSPPSDSGVPDPALVALNTFAFLRGTKYESYHPTLIQKLFLYLSEGNCQSLAREYMNTVQEYVDLLSEGNVQGELTNIKTLEDKLNADKTALKEAEAKMTELVGHLVQTTESILECGWGGSTILNITIKKIEKTQKEFLQWKQKKEETLKRIAGCNKELVRSRNSLLGCLFKHFGMYAGGFPKSPTDISTRLVAHMTKHRSHLPYLFTFKSAEGQVVE